MGRFVCVLAVALQLSAFQYPGQIPPGQTPGQTPGQYPPGQYPPGQGPLGGGGGGISLPSRGHKKNQKATEQQPTIEADGLTLSNDGKKLVIATQDGRTLTMTIISSTRWLKAGNNIAANLVAPRTTVHIAAAEDDEAFLTATTVTLLKDAPGEEAADHAGDGQLAGGGRPAGKGAATADDEEMARPTILKAPDAPGRPVLHRGAPRGGDQGTASSRDDAAPEAAPGKAKASATKPAGTAKAAGDDSVDFTLDAEPAAAKHSNAYDQLIDRTREWAMTFTNGLPNFLCQQSTTRYVEQSRSEGFEPVDVVTAKVLYEDGREKYSAITVGGRRTSKSMMEIGGTTSTGEFASVLGGLFEPATRTEFKFYQSTTVANNPLRYTISKWR